MCCVRALAAAQTVPVRGDVAANMAEHLRLARLAADERAEVVVFPELSLIGYELDLAADLAFSENDARLTPLVSLASAKSITLIVGAPIRMASRLHLGAFIIEPDGTIEVHTKRHLGAFAPDVNPGGNIPPAEETVFEPGTAIPLLQLGSMTAALAICAESLRPSHAREAAERGANTYLSGHFSIPLDVELRHTVLRAHAVKHGMAIVFATYGGPTGGLPASGRSAIWSPTGELLTQLEPSGSGLAVAIQRDTSWQAKALRLNDR